MIDFEQKALEITSKFQYFIDGIRIIQLIDRKNNNSNRKSKRFYKQIISHVPEEFKEAVKTLLETIHDHKTEKHDFRIYSCVNARNLEKADRLFRVRQIERETCDFKTKFNFYKYLYETGISCLMKPASKETNYFLIDLDTKHEKEVEWVDGFFKCYSYTLIYKYETKNGWHFICNPFNPSIFKNHLNKFSSELHKICEIKKDSLLLLYWG